MPDETSVNIWMCAVSKYVESSALYDLSIVETVLCILVKMTLCYQTFVASYYSMSAIDFYCSVDKVQGADGKDRVVVTFDGKYLPYSEQVCVFFLFSPAALFLASSWSHDAYLLATDTDLSF